MVAGGRWIAQRGDEFRPPTVKGQPVAGAPPAMLLFPDISIGDAPVAVAQKK